MLFCCDAMESYLLGMTISRNNGVQLNGQEYIQITRPDINIRMLPSTSSPIIGHAFADEVYILTGEEEKWYSVLLPSGESRWIYKKLAKKIQVETHKAIGKRCFIVNSPVKLNK